MEGKTVSQSCVVMAEVMNPRDANPAMNVHGGVIMRLIDTVAGVVAGRHARSIPVTASVDRLDFYHPIFIGDFVTFMASLNFVGNTSMEIGVRVETENIITGQRRHTSTAYLTYVALDKNGRPMQLPPLILETEDDKRRNQEAKARREARLAGRTRMKERRT